MTTAQPQGFLALPPAGKGPGVLVLHAWWGLNDTIRAFCARLAESGFVAFAPDMYHGQITDTIPGAEELVKSFQANYNQISIEIADSVSFLNEHVEEPNRGIAVIGFSLGAFCALDLSAADPEHIHSVVLFYGTGGADFGNARAAYLGHFASDDPFEPQEGVDELEETLKQAGRPVTFHHYPGTGHWFVEPDRTMAYNPAAAALAWERTLEFLKQSA